MGLLREGSSDRGHLMSRDMEEGAWQSLWQVVKKSERGSWGQTTKVIG